MNKLNLLGISIGTGTYAQFIQRIVVAAKARQSQYTCVANVHMLVEAHKDKRFAHVVNSAAFVTPDGKPIVWALRLLYDVRQERVAGMDLLPDLLTAAEKNSLPVFFYGGTSHLLEKTRQYAEKAYPALNIAGVYSPPFRNLTSGEEKEIAETINTSGAMLVLVILGCPKQEKWMAAMKGKVNAVMVGVGGALPVMIGDQRRAPEWMQKAGLEWLYRLVQEPGRLFKRYAVSNSIFTYLLLKAYLQKRFLQNAA